jgi:hypothetical protein
MATLTNTKIKDTYDGLLKTTDNDVIGASEKVITDGLGNASVLSIGTGSASFSGDVDVNSNSLQLTGDTNPKVLVTDTTNSVSVGLQALDASTKIDSSHSFKIEIVNDIIQSVTSSGVEITGTLSSTEDATINGLTIGKGNGSLSTNVAIGVNALDSVTSGVDNTAIGHSTMQNLTQGVDNAAFGTGAMVSTTTGSYNTSIGSASLPANTTGGSNTAVGLQVMQSNTTGGANTVVGMSALNDNTEGNRNTTLGFGSGNGIITGSENVHIGYSTNSGASDVDNEIVIGASATGNGSNTATYGNSSITSHHFTAGQVNVVGNLAVDTNTLYVDAANNRVGFGTSSPSEKLDVSGTIQSSANEGKLVLNSTATNGKEYQFISIDSGNLGLFDGTAYRLWVAGSGAIGIGTSSPDHKLHLEESDTTSVFLKTENTAGALLVGNNSSGNSFVSSQTSGKDLLFETANSERMRIDSSGNVGIGVTPSAKLHTSSAVSGNAIGALLANSNTSGSSDSASLNFGLARNDGFLFNIPAIKFVKNQAWTGTASTIDGYLSFSTINDESTSERMRIDSSGNVGIGVTPNTSYSKLQVKANETAFALDIIARNAGVNDEAQITFWNDTQTQSRAFIYSEQGFLTFGTGASGADERMRITSSGYTKIANDGSYYYPTYNFHEFNNTANGNEVGVFVHEGTSTPYGVQVRFVDAAPNNTTNYFYNAVDTGATRYIVYSNGNVVNVNGSYGAISDAKLKENIVDASPKLDDLLQVRVRNYNLIGDDKKQLGVVAQELEEVFPSMIDESPDFEEQEVTDEEGNVTKERVDLGTTTKSVKYSVFVPMLIKAMQEQQEIINDLKARIETLENN